MAELTDLVERVRGTIYGARPDLRPMKDRLTNAGINETVTAMRFETATMWQRGDKAQFEPDGEVVELRQDHPSAADVEVFERGADGTTAAAQLVDAIVLKNPRLARGKIEQAIKDAIDNDLWPHVWLWSERTVGAFDPSQEVYELDAADRDVVRMYQYDIADDERLHQLPTGFYEVVGQVASGVPTGATSGRILRIHRVVNSVSTVYYTAKTEPSSADIASLPSELLEMVMLSATGRLLSQAPEERRQRTTGRTRRDEQATDYGLMMAEFTRLRGQYKTVLNQQLKAWRRHVAAPDHGVPWT